MLPLLSHHDHKQVEVFCYSDVRRDDHFTNEIRRHADAWCDTSQLSDEQLASMVRQDRIDILIDLSMHTAGNRLLVFARKPAPVQVTYLSYPSTTGLGTMDYRLTDPFLDPPVDKGDIPNFPENRNVSDIAASSCYSETSILLPATFWCYAAPDVAPSLGPPPALTNSYVTFGCLNQFCKVSRVSIQLWCEILRRLPQSRLILHAPDGSPRDRTRETFSKAEVDPGRVQFVSRVPLRDYLEQYQQIDIALDPFPFAGGTTTCDALWMGVPVVTLSGQTAVSRAGASILSNIGLPHLIARTAQDYLRIATDLAADQPALSRLRTTLRQRMQSSPLMNASQFARDIETAFRRMWISDFTVT
jgi:predicted O-linked N-acetylglucosamine transferase (SPINDLY family)